MNNFLTPEQETISPMTSPERLRELARQDEYWAFLIAQNCQNLITWFVNLLQKESLKLNISPPNPPNLGGKRLKVPQTWGI